MDRTGEMTSPARTHAAAVTPRAFTTAEYHRMADAGIFTEDDRVELINGVIIQMTPIGSPHAGCVDRIANLFARRLQARAIVRVQNPVVLGRYDEPQPDVSLLRPRPDFLRKEASDAGGYLPYRGGVRHIDRL